MSAASPVSPAFKFGTIAVVVAAAIVIAALRFFGDVPMPPRPPPPDTTNIDTRAALAAATESEGAWQSFLEQDARAAGVAAPSVEQMSKMLVFRADTTQRDLAAGDEVDVVGLHLAVKVVKDSDGPNQLLVLSIKNTAEHDLGYLVVASPQPGGAACNSRTPLFHDAMVVGHGATIERSECDYLPDMKLRIDRVETVEVDGLQSVYISRVPPTAVGGDPMLARAHRPHLVNGMVPCNLALSQVLRTTIEDGTVGWRDLIDFYARHRCDSYKFPLEYRAFTKDGERALPAAAE